jgi:hypothetical protein
MNSFEPQPQSFAYSEPPPLDVWTRMVEDSPDAELEKHRQFALYCLSQDIGSQKWTAHIGIVEAAIRARVDP